MPEASARIRRALILVRLIALGLVLFQLGVVLFGLWLVQSAPWIAQNAEPGTISEAQASQMGVGLVTMGAVFGALNLVLAMGRKGQAAWLMHLGNILAAGLSCVLLPLAIPAYLQWMHPEVRAHFGMN